MGRFGSVVGKFQSPDIILLWFVCVFFFLFSFLGFEMRPMFWNDSKQRKAKENPPPNHISHIHGGK